MGCLICGEADLDGREAVCGSCVERYGRQAQERKRDRAPRNEHDTRVATVITCTECGVDDRLPFVPRRKEKVLCRNCAATLLDIHLPGADVQEPLAKPPEDIFEKLGIERNHKERVDGLKISRDKKAGSVVFKRKRSQR
ncbi:MAG TPA: hypothetical protein EYP98_21505 [Planctomycetes bacterium]|jgi:CxxC-x17-CxxC domain-containing protein|nr:hypothetical protein [Planctomycetota bacterium]